MPAKSNAPPKAYALLVYEENYKLEDIINTLNPFKIPYVISPLHIPKDRKPHYHIILDNTAVTMPDSVISTICAILNTPNYSYQTVRNIRSAELYLRHETADSAHKQQFTKNELVTCGNGYELHKATYQGSRDEKSELICNIADKLVEVCSSVANLTLKDLWDMVKDSSFYENIETDLPFKKCVSIALNEIRVHYRFYLQFSEITNTAYEKAQNTLDKQECADVKHTLLKYIQDTIENFDDSTLGIILYDIYDNNRNYRQSIKDCGGFNGSARSVLLRFANVDCNNGISHLQAIIDTLNKHNPATTL